MNPEYQRLLEERIQQENIDKNLEFANEYLPESFGHITMLYIKASINRIPINAFVDTGAQSTIMSQALAERCGLMRLVDRRQAGKAVGVGSCKILGKVHAAEIEIEGKHLTCSFTVIENNSVEFLLGLDMLRRFNVPLSPRSAPSTSARTPSSSRAPSSPRTSSPTARSRRPRTPSFPARSCR
jgi:DNA damage-inducible protein 1